MRLTSMNGIRRRDRTLVFRLSQDEYESLLAATSQGGGRSVSDFIRTAVLATMENGADHKSTPHACAKSNSASAGWKAYLGFSRRGHEGAAGGYSRNRRAGLSITMLRCGNRLMEEVGSENLPVAEAGRRRSGGGLGLRRAGVDPHRARGSRRHHSSAAASKTASRLPVCFRASWSRASRLR